MQDELEILLPKLGESITEATVVQWFKKEGDSVDLDEPLLEVATDKINSEIPAPAAGSLNKILAAPGELVQVGGALAKLSSKEAVFVPAEKEAAPEEKTENTEEMRNFFSPAVLRLVREKGLSMDALDKIPRSGGGGRLTKKDVENFAAKKEPEKSSCPLKTDRVKMTPLRKAIADNMVRSFYEAPHASLVTEVDVTKVMKKIAAEKEAFFEKHGVKLSITSFVAKAMMQAIHAYPLINSSLENDEIVMKKFINLGIAVSVEQGVMVPVIKHAEQMDVPALSKSIADLAAKARMEKLSHEEVQGGSITLTNFGMAKAKIGIPIIRYPEVAILGMGAIYKTVAVLDDDTFGVRKVMNLSLTFDHRVLDGMYGCGFLAEVKKHLEEF